MSSTVKPESLSGIRISAKRCVRDVDARRDDPAAEIDAMPPLDLLDLTPERVRIEPGLVAHFPG
jgi:hypothetical protein